MIEPSTLPPPKFPAPRAPAPTLSLRRRNAAVRALSRDDSVAVPIAPHGLDEVRPAPGRKPTMDSDQMADLERSLRQLQISLDERERVIGEAEAKLTERERDLAEAEALLTARERLVVASRHETESPIVISASEKVALEQLRDTLEKQQATLAEARQGIREREQFLDESETRLFAKVQAQQEKEIELEQREEDLSSRVRQYRETVAAYDPQVAKELEAEDEAARKHRDEFSE